MVVRGIANQGRQLINNNPGTKINDLFNQFIFIQNSQPFSLFVKPPPTIAPKPKPRPNDPQPAPTPLPPPPAPTPPPPSPVPLT
jgi:hypothetical protein